MATKHRSLLSRIVLAGVGTAAAAGWFGVQLAPVNGGAAVSAAPIERLPAAVAPEGTPPGVRNRVAWQPSPIPSTQSPQSPQIPQAPGVRDRAAWQPSPVPSQPNGQG